MLVIVAAAAAAAAAAAVVVAAVAVVVVPPVEAISQAACSGLGAEAGIRLRVAAVIASLALSK